MPERLSELLEDLRWGMRRAWQRLRGGDPGPPDRARVIRRRRAVALSVIALGLFAIYQLVPIPGLPCAASPAKSCVGPAPVDHAIALVPANSDLYLHVDLDRGSSQFSTARDVANRLPHSTQIEQGLYAALGPLPGLSLSRDVGTWVGNEAAFAELGAGKPRPLALLAVKDRKGAQMFVSRLGRGKPRTLRQGNAVITAYPNGLAFTQLRGFLVLGAPSAVRAAIATGSASDRSLSSSAAANAARDSLPGQRLADLYLSASGVKRFLAGGGLASQLDTFADFGASRGVAAALVAHPDGFGLQLDSVLDPAKVKSRPSFFQAFPSFDPSLAGEFSGATLIYLGIANPAGTLQALIDEARRAAPGLASAFGRFETQLRRGGVDIGKQVLPLLSGEAAAGVAESRTGPYLTLVFKGVDEDRARAQMAQLQVPLVAALSPARTGQAPSFGTKTVGDTVVHSVSISPTLNLAYAIFDGKLVVSTNPAGVREAIEGGNDLGGSDAYKATTSGTSGSVSALVFLNLEGLVSRAGPLGLDQIVGGFGADVSKLKALGLSVKSDNDILKTTFFLNIE